MSKFNWEKQNKAEQPKEKRRLSNRSKVIKAYENATKRERERIIKLLEDNWIEPMDWLSVIELIEGEQK